MSFRVAAYLRIASNCPKKDRSVADENKAKLPFPCMDIEDAQAIYSFDEAA